MAKVHNKKKLHVDLTPAIKKLEITIKGLINTRILGGYRSAFRGRGLEFAGYREYAPDEDSSLIDWKASAKSNSLLVKEYEEERSLEVFFIIDVGSSMVFGSTEKLKNEYAAEFAASLAHLILESGDRFGYGLFNNKVKAESFPQQGRNQFYKFTKDLVDPNNYGGRFDLDEAIKYALGHLKNESLVLIVSDFIGLKSEWKRYIKSAGKKFDLIGVMIRDPRDQTLPEDSYQVAIENPHSGEQMVVDPLLIKEKYERLVKEEEGKIRQEFLKAGADFLELNTGKSFIKPLIVFFKVRSEKWR